MARIAQHSKRFKTNKTEKVLEHLKNKGSITSLQAIDLYGATRLSAIIFNLRRNHKIDGENMICSDKYGNEARYVKYIYCGEC